MTPTLSPSSIEYNDNTPKMTIICSRVDPASQNIKNHLQSMREWSVVDVPCDDFEDLSAVYEHDGMRLVEVASHHIYQDGIDRKLEECGMPASILVFASKHKSGDGRKLLTAHITGNPNTADFGGNPGELARAAPYALRSLLMTMRQLAQDMDYDVSMESTHHGPTDLKVPSVYAEIGSGEGEWNDVHAGEVVARSILGIDCHEVPVALGFGGGHYATRQSELLFEAGITFGHNFPNYQLEYVDEDLFAQAVEKSGADFVYLDRRSMSTDDRARIGAMANDRGLLVLRDGDIREMKGIGWSLFKYVFQKAQQVCPSGRVRFANGMREYIRESGFVRSADISSMKIIRLDEALVRQVGSVDRNNLVRSLQSLDVVYIECENGTLSNDLLAFTHQDVEGMLDKVINECIKILKERYEIEYIPYENILCISDSRFSPKLANELGVPHGPMFGELAEGHPVVIDGKTISPDMVHESIRTKLELRNTII